MDVLGTVVSRYRIHLQQGQQTMTIEYRVVDTPISRLWQQVTARVLEDPTHHIPVRSQWSKNITEKSRDQQWQELQQLVDQARLEFPELERLPDLTTITDDQALSLLNQIHLRFHSLEEQGQQSDILGEINNRIHEIELEFTGRSYASVRAGFFLAAENTANEIPVDTNDVRYQRYWNHIPRAGDLTLGYHTVGKNIYTAMLSDDQQLVRDRMIRPQKTVSTEVAITVASRADPRAAIYRRHSVQQWLQRHQLTEYIDMRRPENNLYGEPLLAELEHSVDLRSVLAGARFVTVELEIEQRPKIFV